MKISYRHVVSIAVFACTVLYPARSEAQTYGQEAIPMPSTGVGPEVGVAAPPSSLPEPQPPSEVTQQPGSVPTSAPLAPPQSPFNAIPGTGGTGNNPGTPSGSG